MDFETVLPRLVATYETGRLVPFIGAGMSRPNCTDWLGLVHKLEHEAGVTASAPLEINARPDEIVRRGNAAARSLRAREDGAFVAAMRRALVDRGGEDAPPQTGVLARLPWPLVLTTNYDNYYAAAFSKRFPDRLFAVIGRNAEHCQRVLNSLSTPGRALLWALQGYLDEPCQLKSEKAENANARLTNELVVGHDEYRRVTYRDLHFRRAFAEVFRHRSLLFLGSGIREAYLQELFGEVLELYGPSTRPHYAFIPEGEVDPEFMLARFQIVAIEYEKDKHDEVTSRLNGLADELIRSVPVPVSWSWGRIDIRTEQEWKSVPELEIVRGPLPETRTDGECLAVSAGGTPTTGYFFTPGIWALLDKWGVKQEEQPPESPTQYLGFYRDRHVYAVRARSENDERTLSAIYDAALQLFKEAAEQQYRCIRMQLLAAGGTGKHQESTGWTVRPFPERFSFIQIVRAWGDWRRGAATTPCRLALHVMSEPVYADVASGRLDVLELLSCRDLRFWAEIVPRTGEIERRLFQEMPDVLLDEIVQALNLSADQWTVEVSPATTVEELARPNRPVRACLNLNLQGLGVVPGSTLHFRRPEAG